MQRSPSDPNPESESGASGDFKPSTAATQVPWDHPSRWSASWQGSDQAAHPTSNGPRDLLRVLLKRRIPIAIAFVSILFLSLTLSSAMMTETYEARTTLLIENRPMRVMAIDELNVAPRATRDFYATQAEIIEARSLAATVIDELGLQMPVDAYVGRLGVEAKFGTSLVDVTFTHSNPKTASLVANAHAQAYIDRGLSIRQRATQEAADYLDNSLNDLKARLEKSETKLNEYRQATGIVSLDDGESLAVDRIEQLEEKLADLRAKRISNEVFVRLAKDDVNAAIAQIKADGTAIEQLRDQVRKLEAETAARGMRGPPSPTLNARLSEAKRHLREEYSRYIRRARASHDSLVAEEAQLAAELSSRKSEALAMKDASVAFAILQREVETNRELHSAVLQRRKEIGMTAGLKTSNIFVIDPAFPPSTPTGLNPLYRLIALILLSAILAVAFGIAAGFMDDTLEVGEVETVLGLPILGVVPKLTKVSAAKPEDMLPENVDSDRWTPAFPGATTARLTESYRAIRTSLLLSRPGEPPRVILITSSTHSEGKTATALNLAASLAQPDAPVLIIDGDLRRPRCHTVVGAEPGPGLAEVLAGQVELHSVLQKVGPSLYLLPASGKTPPDPVALLGSPRMASMLNGLAQRFQFIAIDAPPLLPVSDALALSPAVDGVLFVVGSDTTKLMAQKARTKLSTARAKVLGIVLNGVDPKLSGEVYESAYYEEAS